MWSIPVYCEPFLEYLFVCCDTHYSLEMSISSCDIKCSAIHTEDYRLLLLHFSEWLLTKLYSHVYVC